MRCFLEAVKSNPPVTDRCVLISARIALAVSSPLPGAAWSLSVVILTPERLSYSRAEPHSGGAATIL